ncbi:LOB domain-containing protein 41 [Beta vulgaris subsp. vulgaris]|uniref:LOB domain-containing protein 41 n=1 Tax=Beta vulgaris subsp. vulgaris TaxID=3555 RepID=UPI00203708EC|nr:LOB domain-containing protein 41 [Beta vulgaris subsp. vulgaris]
MRMSCNGCRVLRKGCSEDCSIRPCLQWIKSPESQANATVFLAKFYGRAGLMNLINAGPENLRPAIFRSLLYEACGRMVNPIYGSVGLLWSGQWQLCQNAIEAVLKGAPITPIPTEAAANPPPIKGAYDIRHVCKDDHSTAELHRVKPSRNRFKRVGSKSKPAKVAADAASALQMMAAASKVTESTRRDSDELNGAGSSTSHDSTVSHQDEPTSTTDTSLFSNEATVDAAIAAGGDYSDHGGDDGEVELELTLGFGFDSVGRTESKSGVISQGNDQGLCGLDLGLV